jgi:hypothetical protein
MAKGKSNVGSQSDRSVPNHLRFGDKRTQHAANLTLNRAAKVAKADHDGLISKSKVNGPIAPIK